MLTDCKLKSIKPKDKPYKINDRDGMYAYVSTTGKISFRYNYAFGNKRQTYTIGQYGIMSLNEAREKLLEAKKNAKQ